MNKVNLGKRIREARLQKHLTQKDVVGEYMTRNMLSKIENGSATPSVKSLAYLAEALGLPMSYFVSGSGETPQSMAQMEAIGQLADRLTQPDPPCSAIAFCLKARMLMTSLDYEGALSLLKAQSLADHEPEGVSMLCKVMEDCCALMGDYKQAYDIALRRMEK